jgi:hypothetical protein
MAFIYEVNGQRVEFEKEPTERDIDEAAKSLRSAPQPTRKVVEGAGGGAIIYPNMGRRPESQNQNRQENKDMPFQTARGVVTGALGGPSDLLNLPGVLYGAATGQPSPYTVPYGSEQFNEMLPGKSDAPSAKLARLGGEVMAPFPSLKALKAIPGAVRGAGDVVSGAVGTGTGYIARPGRAPRGYQVPSQRNPIGPAFTPPEELAKFERGELPYGQMPEQRPISELPQGRLDRAAMMLSGGNIPNSGQGARAFGERLGETYRNPLTAAADIGSMFFTGGVPVLTTLRGGLAGAQALADMRLAKKGFTPELPKILDEYQTGVRPMPGVQPGPMPRSFQAAGPVSPGGLAAATPAAQAAMATTQRVARLPAQPKPAAQPFVLPDAGTHYTQAEQVGANFGDIFDKAVTARATDLLRDARQTGKSLTSQQANDLAFDEIKEFRRNNVDAFKEKTQPAPEPTGPVSPTVTDKEFIEQFNPPKPDYELVSDQGIWKRLQDKTAADIPLEVNEQTAVRRITNKYGQNPFQTGDLKGNSVLEAPKTEAPKVKLTAEELVDKQKWKALQNLNDYDKHTAGQKAEIDRITKKYGDEPFGLGDITGQTTDPNATFTPYAPDVQSSLKDVTMGTKNPNAGMRRSRTESAVYKIGKNTTVEKSAYDEVATQFGLKPINWDNMPNVQGMPIKEARKEIRQFVAAQFRPQYEKRVQRSKMIDVQKSMMTPEELAADQAETIALAAKAEERMKKLVGNKSSSPKPTTPKVETPKPTTPEVAGPVRPEGAVDTPKMTNAELLELIKARSNKGKAPPDAMKMTTGNGPSANSAHANITDAAGDLMVKQMTNNNGMFETSYNKGKDMVFEQKYPGYHIVEVQHPNGGTTTYKKVGDEYYVGGFNENGMPKQIQVSKTKPEGWFSVEDEITKGK